jgi:hypothetical protein
LPSRIYDNCKLKLVMSCSPRISGYRAVRIYFKIQVELNYLE